VNRLLRQTNHHVSPYRTIVGPSVDKLIVKYGGLVKVGKSSPLINFSIRVTMRTYISAEAMVLKIVR